MPALFEQKAKQNTKELHHARRKMNELASVLAAASLAGNTDHKPPIPIPAGEISEVSRLLAHTSSSFVTELYPMCGWKPRTG